MPIKLLPKKAEGWMWHRPWFPGSRCRLQGGDPQPNTGPQLVINRAAQQEVTRRQNRNHPSFSGPWKNFIFHETGPRCQKGWEPLLERKGQLRGEVLPQGGLDLGGCACLPLKGHGPRLLRGPHLSQELQQEVAGQLPLGDTRTTASAALLQCPPVRETGIGYAYSQNHGLKMSQDFYFPG